MIKSTAAEARGETSYTQNFGMSLQIHDVFRVAEGTAPTYRDVALKLQNPVGVFSSSLADKD